MKKDLAWLRQEVEKDVGYKYMEGDIYYVSREHILGLIDQVEQPELPVIPDYVAEWIRKNKGTFDLVQVFWEIGEGGLVNLDVDYWVEKNDELFARSWLDGYTVEEKKYSVTNGIGVNLLYKEFGEITEYQYHERPHPVDSYKLTEKEIKEFKDGVYWPFANEVHE